MIKIFKKDSKGKIRVLQYWTEGATLHQAGGLLDGALVYNSKVCTGKNIGKTNETTPEQQAIFEMESTIKKKLQEDYFNTVEEAQTSEVILPMLAKVYKEHKHKIDWTNCYIQPKLDGQRCLIVKKGKNITLLSRDGIDIQEQHKSMNHILEAASKLQGDIILDGELYRENTDFQDIMKAIKKYRKGISESIKFYCYDTILNAPFSERLAEVNRNITQINEMTIQKLFTLRVSDEKDVNFYHEDFIANGFEGTIVRHGTSAYKLNGRSDSLLKYKNFDDNDFLIVDIKPAENRPEWGIVTCKLKDDITFDATPKMTEKEKAELLKNKSNYIGKTAIITHFGFTDAGVPRFPVFKGIRLDKIIK